MTEICDSAKFSFDISGKNPLPATPSGGNVVRKGASYGTDLIIVPSLCVAVVQNLQNLDLVLEDLKIAMKSSDSPSGTIIFPYEIKFDVPMDKRREFANAGISFRKSTDSSDVLKGAQHLIAEYGIRLEKMRQHWESYSRNSVFPNP